MGSTPVGGFHALTTATRLRLLESVMEHAYDGVLLIEVASHPTIPFPIIYSNAAFSTMTGYPPEEIVGASLAFLSGPAPDPTALAQHLASAAHDITTHFEMRAYRKDRTPFWVALSIVPLTDAETGTRYLTIVLRDITAQKDREQAGRVTTTELARSNRALQEFASVASHDLQEPLRKILAFGNFLAEQSGAALDEEGRDYLARMLNAAGRMQILINDLLTFARLTAQARPFVSVDLTEVVGDVLADLEAQIAHTRGRVMVGDLATIPADPRQMRMLFQNLISNALKFARLDVPPYVTINGRVIARPSADAGGETDARWYEVTVTDNGIGFDPQFAEKIFAIFQRLHRRTDYEGTGIGLAICREIVTYHHGTITATSIPGEGATFCVQLPQQHDTRGAS